MLKSIEERMEEQLLEKNKQRFVGEYAKGFVPDEIKDRLMEAYTAQFDFKKVNNQTGEIELYTSEDFEKQMHQKHLDTLVAEFKTREFRRWLRDLILQIPNDQELGAAIREWYNRTEGKFI